MNHADADVVLLFQPTYEGWCWLISQGSAVVLFLVSWLSMWFVSI